MLSFYHRKFSVFDYLQEDKVTIFTNSASLVTTIFTYRHYVDFYYFFLFFFFFCLFFPLITYNQFERKSERLITRTAIRHVK